MLLLTQYSTCTVSNKQRDTWTGELCGGFIKLYT